MSTSFSVTWDYRCPFARNAHEHLLTGLEAGADWELTYSAFSLDQAHVEEGQAAVWEEPDRYPGLLVNLAGIVVRDRVPEQFATVHRALFAARHDQGLDLRDARCGEQGPRRQRGRRRRRAERGRRRLAAGRAQGRAHRRRRPPVGLRGPDVHQGRTGRVRSPARPSRRRLHPGYHHRQPGAGPASANGRSSTSSSTRRSRADPPIGRASGRSRPRRRPKTRGWSCSGCGRGRRCDGVLPARVAGSWAWWPVVSATAASVSPTGAGSPAACPWTAWKSVAPAPAALPGWEPLSQRAARSEQLRLL